jgi:alpha-L-rhamnosidase
MGIDPGTTSGEILSSSYYFRFYLARALDHAGMGDQYLASLKPWRTDSIALQHLAGDAG